MSAKMWKCEVCGYIHTGNEPPENCPVCGVDKSMFSPFEAVKQQDDTESEKWKCTICDHIHEGSEPPDICPVCSAKKSMFKPVENGIERAADISIKDIVIVGGGIAALSAAENARLTSDSVNITIIAKEEMLPYYRLNLTRYLAGEVDSASLPVKSLKWFEDNRIEVVYNEVKSLDLENKKVEMKDGTSLGYDRLILANGSHPFVPPIMGGNLKGVHVFRTIEDAEKLLSLAKTGKKCVCVGGGLLGLETAGALNERGVKVEVVEGFDWLLPRQLPENAGNILQKFMEEKGIKTRTASTIAEILGDEEVRGVKLKSGEELEADFIVLSTGVRPNSYLARQADIKVKAGVRVNDSLFTSDPNVLAAGDVAEHAGIVYGIWPASHAEGMVAGINAAGGSAQFNGIAQSNRLKVLGIDLFSIGKISPEDAGYDICEKEINGNYHYLVVRDGRLAGAVLLGNTENSNIIQELIESGGQLKESAALLEKYPFLTDASNNV